MNDKVSPLRRKVIAANLLQPFYRLYRVESSRRLMKGFGNSAFFLPYVTNPGLGGWGGLNKFWRKRYPFYIPFIEKRYPSHIPTLEHCNPFPGLFNEVNEQYYRRISSITRRNVKQTTSVIYSVHVVRGSQGTPDIRRTNSECFCLRPS